MRAHGHANRDDAKMQTMAWELICKHGNGISALKSGGKQHRNGAKVLPKHEKVPKEGLWHQEWHIARPNMHNMDMEYKYRSKAAPK